MELTTRSRRFLKLSLAAPFKFYHDVSAMASQVSALSNVIVLSLICAINIYPTVIICILCFSSVFTYFLSCVTIVKFLAVVHFHVIRVCSRPHIVHLHVAFITDYNCLILGISCLYINLYIKRCSFFSGSFLLVCFTKAL